MAGIYLHIPFCKTRCNYCDFYSSTNESMTDRYVNSLCKELEIRKNELPDETIQTIYFGGGTPSQLSIDQLNKIFDVIFTNYTVAEDAEITIETNPDDLSEQYLKGLSAQPFNRLSMGIQSFNDDDLKTLNRRHTSLQAIEAINLCLKYKLENISIDLMYGLPGQTLELWMENLDIACKLPVKHISAYHLTYEKGTPLHRKLANGEISETDEEVSIAMFEALRAKLIETGFQHYEISNFAREGYISRHNSSYWKGIPYLGIGASAHSFNGINRCWNISDFKVYIQQAEQGKFTPEIEESTLYSRYNDFIITTLRTSWGLDTEILQEKFGDFLSNFFLLEAKTLIRKGLLLQNNNIISISSKGLFVSDAILSELLYVE